MKLFHGSYMKIEYPEISKGRTKVDFGQGFYLTGIKSQAEKWSKVIANHRQIPSIRFILSNSEIMRDSVLWRKQSRIVMLLAKKKNITPEQALDIYYSSRTAQLLSDPNTGLQLMSDQYVLEDLLEELEKKRSI
mgnify:CR=1 FL=1